MFWYIVILFLLLISNIWKIGDRRYKIIGRKEKMVDMSALSSCIIMLIFAAFRANTVGADTRQQQIIMDLCRYESWRSLATAHSHFSWFFLADIEMGYRYYCKILSVLSTNPQIITIANSILLMFLVYRLAKMYSRNQWLSAFLFFTLGFYQTALNMAPSMIASLIVMNGFVYIKEKKFWKYMCCILIGSLFHYSVVLFIPIYFCTKYKLSRKRFWICILTMFVSVPFLFTIINIIGPRIMPQRYLDYLQLGVSMEQILVYLAQIIAICMGLWIRRYEDIYEKSEFDLDIFLVESLMYFLTMQTIGFSRAAFLFAPYIIVTIPNLLLQDEEKHVEAALTDTKIRINKKTLLIVIYVSVVYILRIMVNNIGRTMPYVFC